MANKHQSYEINQYDDGHSIPVANAEPVYTSSAAPQMSYAMGGGGGYVHQMERVIRHGFIRKVYTIISVMLLEMLVFVALFRNDELAMKLQPSRGACVVDGNVVVHPDCGSMKWLYYFSLVAGLLSYYMLICCIKNARTYPTNYVLLGIFSTCWGFMIGVITSIYNTNAVVMALATTAGIVVGLTFFACQTKYDFTGHGGYLFAAIWSFFIFGIIASIMFYRSDPDTRRVVNYVYAGIGVLLFSAFLVYDTQLMMGGGHKQSFSVDDYVFAAIMIYLDIINIFLYLLALFGGNDR